VHHFDAEARALSSHFEKNMSILVAFLGTNKGVFGYLASFVFGCPGARIHREGPLKMRIGLKMDIV
jgi:hypothetical protein